jgi:hypothetical protein
MKRKLNISIAILSLIVFSIFSMGSSSAQDISTGEAIGIAGVAIAVYNIADRNCDDRRKEGTLQTRCKDGMCQTVSCISFRSACNPAITNACD